MQTDLTTPAGRAALYDCYHKSLLDDVIPFWLKFGIDHEHGGYLTALNRDGSLLDTDKSVWFQGRGAWMFATLYNTIERNPSWLDAAKTGIEFMRKHCYSAEGKMYFTVTREGKPLRMRRYVYSESFAAIANAAFAKATGDSQCGKDARKAFENYLLFSFTKGKIAPKVDPDTRAMSGIGSYMICMVTAQEMRANLGDAGVYQGRTCTQWIDFCIEKIRTVFMKPDIRAVMEVTGANGEILDHFDGRTLNPGHAIEAAWFILHEAKQRGDESMKQTGLTILDWMWERGWDKTHGGLLYFTDVYGLPVQEYWHDMKFWWPHCEAIIATQLAYQMTGDTKYANWHRAVHDWSFTHFADPEYGEWYGYLHRDGSVSVPLKGNMWKGPFHLPRMLWYCRGLLA